MDGTASHVVQQGGPGTQGYFRNHSWVLIQHTCYQVHGQIWLCQDPRKAPNQSQDGCLDWQDSPWTVAERSWDGAPGLIQVPKTTSRSSDLALDESGWACVPPRLWQTRLVPDCGWEGLEPGVEPFEHLQTEVSPAVSLSRVCQETVAVRGLKLSIGSFENF